MPASFACVGLVGRSQRDGLEPVLEELITLLHLRGHEVLLEERLAELVPSSEDPRLPIEEIGARADLVIVVGGDGSLLGAARTLARFDLPVLGVNRGRLGFLTDITPDELSEQVSAVLDGQYDQESRFLLDATVVRDGKVIGSADALNDVVVNSGTSAQMIEFELYVNDVFVYRQRADGLIVSLSLIHI